MLNPFDRIQTFMNHQARNHPVVKHSTSHASRVALSSVLASGLLTLAVPLAQAQTYNTAEPLRDFRTQDGGSDLLNGNGSGQSGFMNFLQNAIQGTSRRDPNEVASEQQENLNDATSQFRAKQAELLRKQQAAPPATAPDLTNLAPASMPGSK
jgi:hypothetical protein